MGYLIAKWKNVLGKEINKFINIYINKDSNVFFVSS